MTIDETAEQLEYEGRVLPKQNEEVVDQGLAFDVTTLLNRRRVLQLLGIGAGTLTLAACSTGTGGSGATAGATATAGTTSAREIPEETAGPYPGDGSNGVNVLEESGVIRSDIRSSFGTGTATAAGVPMTLTLNVTDMVEDDAAFAGVAVYVWHCDRQGDYSLYSDGLTNENYLRGVQVADDSGTVRFTSIFPACYSGRWPHIHFEVYPDAKSITDSTTAIATSQVAMPKATCDTVYASDGYENSSANLAKVTLTSDNVFGDDGGESQLATVTGSVSKGYSVSLVVPIDTSTTAGGGGAAPSGSDGHPSGVPAGGPGGTPPSGAPGGPPTS